MSIPCNNYPREGYYAPKAPEGLKDTDVSKFSFAGTRTRELPGDIAYDSSLQEDLMANLENLFDDAYSIGEWNNHMPSLDKEKILKEYCESIQNVILLAVRNNLP